MSIDDSPSPGSEWRVESLDGFESLKYHDTASLEWVGDNDCLVKIEAASLNFRDLIIPMVIHHLLWFERERQVY